MSENSSPSMSANQTTPTDRRSQTSTGSKLVAIGAILFCMPILTGVFGMLYGLPVMFGVNMLFGPLSSKTIQFVVGGCYFMGAITAFFLLREIWPGRRARKANATVIANRQGSQSASP